MDTLQGKPEDASPFHSGERRVQARLGVQEVVEARARRVVRPILLEQHRQFYTRLPFIVAAARDASGQPWATLLVGQPGFIASPDTASLQIAAHTLPGDALGGSFSAGTELGLLGIELETRRRNRLNGVITEADRNGFTLGVVQSFGNCPQYITERSWREAEVLPMNAPVRWYRELTAETQQWVTSADTLFIASGYRGEGQHAGYGMDASHRGGAVGFVKVVGTRRLLLPDYAGNNYFNTIGNIVADPRVALLFVDFEKGSLLQIGGKAVIDWDSAEVANHPGAQRLIVVDVEQVVHLDGVLPLRWSAAG